MLDGYRLDEKPTRLYNNDLKLNIDEGIDMSQYDALMDILKIRKTDLLDCITKIKSETKLNISNDRLTKAVKQIEDGLYLVEAAIVMAEKENGTN